MNRKQADFAAAPSSLSIIIPMLNEADAIVRTLTSAVNSIQKNISDRVSVELILVDGGSEDNSVELARELLEAIQDSDFRFQILNSVSGRTVQMNLGAENASGDLLVFLHADTIVPADFIAELAKVLRLEVYGWGRFDVALSGWHPMLRIVEWFMNYRSRLTSVATGDQALFIRRDIFKDLGGFVNIPLMEDVEICKRLREISLPYCSSLKVITSSRRWESNGIMRTIFLMWRLRYAYYRGADPDLLAQQYGKGKTYGKEKI
ncbi:MAG: TIGR04283 family arsenosugar biosynthesis glycosyltransferase [Pseudomonadales bacterium]|nr:TIGR04283 family arsenosugar biosynthesis glycosyltransferase [Pseudomonadales bacterium]